MHHAVTTGFIDTTRWCDGTAVQMDEESDWWTTSGKIGLFPIARVKGIGRQQDTQYIMTSANTTVANMIAESDME